MRGLFFPVLSVYNRFKARTRILGYIAASRLVSMGTVLYEMATGTMPFQGDTWAAVFDEIFHKSPVPPSRLNPELPGELDGIIGKSLEKDRRLRYQSATELRADLQRLKGDRDSGQTAASAEAGTARIRSLAVLPFANLSADKENEYFSDGLAEEIINALAQLPGLRVTARTSSFSFRGKEADVREIGARLHVENILEGSVRRAGGRIRVTAQLVSTADGYHLWSERYDRDMSDVFAVQDEIARAIADRLRVRLAYDQPLVKRYTQNLEAFNLCLKARHHFSKLSQEGREKALQDCERAIVLDPAYALPHVVMAECLWGSTYLGFVNPRESLPKAKSAALNAIRLDDTIAEAHGALGLVLGTCEFDWSAAEREFRRALDLNPASALVRGNYAFYFLRALGRLEEALTEMRRALDLSPLDPLFSSYLGYLFHVVRQFERAIEQYHLVMELAPYFYLPHCLLSATYVQVGRLDEAAAAAEKANALSGRHSMTLGGLGRVYALAGRTAEARRLLEELHSRRRAGYVPPSFLAYVYRGLRELDRGMEWMARGVEERDLNIVVTLKTEPGYDDLRSHPAFLALLGQMNLQG